MHLNTPKGVIAFRCECTKSVLERNPDTVAWPWPVDDLKNWMPLPKGRFETDVTFHGWVSTGLCEEALQSLERAPLDLDIRRDKRFYGYLSKQEQGDLRTPFLEAMQKAPLSLSVRSIPSGVIRYRFYEAMSMGRIPIHVNDGCVYPLADRIPYDTFMIKIPESRVGQTGEIVAEKLLMMGHTQLVRIGERARYHWERWLSPNRWVENMTTIVKERLGL